MKQQLIAKFGKKFALKPKTGEIVEGIHYAADGSVLITNRHYGLRIKNAHKLESPVTIHATKGIPIEGEYPDLSKVFPNKFDIEIQLSEIQLSLINLVDHAKYVTMVAQKIDKKLPIGTLNIDSSGSLNLTAKTDKGLVSCSATLAHTDVDPSKFGNRTINVEYFQNAVEVFEAANSKSVFLKTQQDRIAPIIISDSNDIDVIILPYRVPE